MARALGVLRPRLAVFENVAGHLSLGFDTVLADLARIGFDADWCCVRASDVGAAHQRNRIFLLYLDTLRAWGGRFSRSCGVPVSLRCQAGRRRGRPRTGAHGQDLRLAD
ncbi:DNA cytosine methyltransferase [Streptomyces sioyaensis]|uniref:DNA cytosine methyltransferase n=1 Tax=Streptomyces sioyaensis TaxID=67364 RepID=UPI0037A98E3F